MATSHILVANATPLLRGFAGRKVVFAFLGDDESGCMDEEFDLADFELEWSGWEADIGAWLASPRFSIRDEVSSG